MAHHHPRLQALQSHLLRAPTAEVSCSPAQSVYTRSASDGDELTHTTPCVWQRSTLLKTRDGKHPLLAPRPLTSEDLPQGANGLTVTPEEIDFFKTNGFLVKRQLLKPAALAPFINAFWQTVEHATGCVRRDDPSSWIDAGERWPCDGRDGRAQKNHTNGGVCLSGPSLGSGGNLHWDCSHLPGFLEATSASHAALHVVEALIGAPVKIPTRCRGLYTIFPGARTQKQQSEANLGPHNDQETQQLLSTTLLGDVVHHDGNFLVWPGSHRIMYEGFTEEINPRPSDRNQECHRLVRETIQPVEFTGRTGDVLFWHNRLIHSSGLNFGGSKVHSGSGSTIHEPRVRIAAIQDYQKVRPKTWLKYGGTPRADGTYPEFGPDTDPSTPTQMQWVSSA
jgi:hypothetical protein